MIALRAVSKSFGSVARPLRVLEQLDLDVAVRDVVVVTGPSGAGKTTLLTLIAGLTRPDAGRIVVAGHDLKTLSDRETSRLRAEAIGVLFQGPSLLADLSALDNVRLPRRFAPRLGDGADDAGRLLGQVGLGDRCGAFPRELSAGQRRRVALARALINRPSLLLCDEPTSDLDHESAAVVCGMIRGVQESGTTVVVTTHDDRLAALAQRRLRLEHGVLVEG